MDTLLSDKTCLREMQLFASKKRKSSETHDRAKISAEIFFAAIIVGPMFGRPTLPKAYMIYPGRAGAD